MTSYDRNYRHCAFINELFEKIIPMGVSQHITVTTRSSANSTPAALDHVYTNRPEILTIFISMTLLARIHGCIHCSFIHCSFIHCSISGLHFSARKLGFWLLLAASNLDCLPLAGFEFCILKVMGRGSSDPAVIRFLISKRA